MKEKIRKLILIISICVFLFSAGNLVKIYFDYKKIDDLRDDLKQEVITEPETSKTDKKEDIRIAWPNLLEINSDVVAWIRIPDTKIDYPVVQGENNDTYLHLGIDKQYLNAGTIFVEEDNNPTFEDDNTILYGHNMKNGSMFHDLKKYVEQNYANEHPYIYIYLPTGYVNKYKVITSAYIDARSDFYTPMITDKVDYLKQLSKKNALSNEVDINSDQPLLMLSTCYSASPENMTRIVLFGTLESSTKQ